MTDEKEEDLAHDTNQSPVCYPSQLAFVTEFCKLVVSDISLGGRDEDRRNACRSSQLD